LEGYYEDEDIPLKALVEINNNDDTTSKIAESTLTTATHTTKLITHAS